MPSRIAGCVVRKDGSIKVVRLASDDTPPAENTIDIRRFKDPMIAQAVKLGGLATIYQGQEPFMRVHKRSDNFYTIKRMGVEDEHKTDLGEAPRLPIAPVPQVRMW